jgi:hypothetical protein
MLSSCLEVLNIPHVSMFNMLIGTQCVMGVGLYVGCSQFDEGNTVNTTRFCPGLTATTGDFHGTCIL